LLHFAQRRQSFIDNLLQLDELDVVAQANVEMVSPEPVQAHVHTLDDALCGEIKVGEIVAAELGAECVIVARHVAQRDTEQHFAHAAPVKGRGIDAIQSAVEGDMNRPDGFVERHFPKFLSERRGAEAENGKLEGRLPERSCSHCGEIARLATRCREKCRSRKPIATVFY
jgi:hypothetical protein